MSTINHILLSLFLNLSPFTRENAETEGSNERRCPVAFLKYSIYISWSTVLLKLQV